MFPLFLKLTGRGELVFMGFVLKVLDSGCRWTSGSSGVFKSRSIPLGDQPLLVLPSQIQKEHSIEHLLSCCIVLLMVKFLRPKVLKQHKTDLEQNPLGTQSQSSRPHMHKEYCFSTDTRMEVLAEISFNLEN